MTYAYPAWEFAADTRLLKLQRLQNKVLSTIGNFPRHIPVCELHKAFGIPYIYDYITKLCRKQAKIIQIHGNANVCNIGQGKANRNIKNLRGLSLVAVKRTTVQVIRLLLYYRLQMMEHDLLY
jgi:hypothetical protein